MSRLLIAALALVLPLSPIALACTDAEETDAASDQAADQASNQSDGDGDADGDGDGDSEVVAPDPEVAGWCELWNTPVDEVEGDSVIETDELRARLLHTRNEELLALAPAAIEPAMQIYLDESVANMAVMEEVGFDRTELTEAQAEDLQASAESRAAADELIDYARQQC